MEWATAFKDFGFPAVMCIVLLYILTKNLEQVKSALNKISRQLAVIQHILDIADQGKEDSDT